MKILMATMSLGIGGAETHIVELCKALASKGHSVSVTSFGGVYEKELAEAGIKHFSLPLHRKSPVCLIKSYFGLKKLIRAEGFDVVHAHARIPAMICGLLSHRMKFRFMTTCHGVYDVNPLLRRFSDWGSHTLAISTDIKKYLIESYNIPYDNITLTINGIDTEKFSRPEDKALAAESLGLPASRHRIVYVSRIDRECAQISFQLLCAAPRLFERYDDLQIVLVGDGNCFAELKAEADRVNEQLGREVCILTGAQTKINRYVATADIFVGVSRSALEAMAGEVPTILAGAQGYIGIFDESKLQSGLDTNFCCRGCGVSDAEKLFCDIDSLFSASEDELRALGAYNREVVLEHYSISSMAEDALAAYRQLAPFEPYKYGDIIMCGYYGFHNNGDDQILRTTVASLKKELPGIKITALSATPKQTAKYLSINSIHRYNAIKILLALRHAKLMICGGGSLITDVTSNRSLVYYSSIIRTAHRLGCKTMIYSGGIGPCVNSSNRKYMKATLSCMDLLALREQMSADFVRELGVTAPVKLTADPAFLSERADKNWTASLAAQLGIKPDGSYFALSVRPWRKCAPDFKAQIVSACRELEAKHGLTPLIVPMQHSQDGLLCDRLAEQTGGILIEDRTASELAGIFSLCKFVIGMRLHSIIYSAVVSCPVICLDYDPKIKALASKLDVPFVFDVKELSAKAITDAADMILADREGYAVKLEEHANELKAAAELGPKLVSELLEQKEG